MISAHHLTKIVSGQPLLHDVTLHVARQESVRLSGTPTGARTTLLRILSTLVAPTSGTLSIDGIDARADVSGARRRVAYVCAGMLASSGLTVEEYLWAVACARGVAPDGEVVGRLGRAGIELGSGLDALPAWARAAVALTAALVVRPDVILLDNVLAGVPGTVRTSFVQAIREAREDGATLIVASDDDDELSLSCGRVVTLRDGRLDDGPASLSRMEDTACVR